MPKDYKNARRQRLREKSSPRWRFFFAGLVLGLSASAGIFVVQHGAYSLVARQPMVAPVSEVKTESLPAANEPKTKFEFYTMLPAMEVAVDEDEIEAPV